MFGNWQRFQRRHLNRPVVTALALTLALTALPASANTVTAVMHSDLRVIDPGFTTAYITRDHGYMVYDSLLSEDANFGVRPITARFRRSRGTSNLLTTSVIF